MWAGLWGRLAQNSPCESIMKILRTMNLEKKIFKKCMISALSAVMLMAVMAGCENAGGTVSDVSETGSVGVDAPYKDTASLGGAAAVTGQIEGVGYTAKLYNSDTGLPTSDANAVFASSDGFIWVGGYSGLIRYDGTSFERQDSSGGITNVNSIYEDSKGRLWIGTNDNGVVCTHAGESMHFSYDEGLDIASINSICEDADGNIIIATIQGLYYIDGNMEIGVMTDSQIKDVFVRQLYRDKSGYICGVTKTGALFRIKDLRVTDFYNGEDIGIEGLYTIFPSPDDPDEIWLGTDLGLVYRGRFSDNFKTVEKHKVYYAEALSATEPINCISCAAGRIWVLSNSMVFYADEKGEFRAIEGLPLTGGIEGMTVDFEGNPWFASRRQGVMKIVANKFLDMADCCELDQRIVNTTCIYDDKLYIGTDTGLQIVNSDNRGIRDRLTNYLGDTRVRCIIKDKDDNLWLSTYTNDLGLVCYTKDGRIFNLTEEDGLPDNKTRAMIAAPDGTVLSATNGGLAVIRNGVIERVVDKEKGLGVETLLTVEATDDGKYYLGSDGGGIYVVDGNNITHLSHEDGLTSDVILRLKRDDKRNVIWIVTSNSIQYIQNGVVKSVESFPYSNNYDIIFDSGDRAWILASNGIYVADAGDMISGSDYDYLYFNVADGMASVPTSNSFSCLDDNGNLYIAGRNGVSLVNIEDFFIEQSDIKFSIPYITSDEETYYPDEDGRFILPYDARNITIYGYALTYMMHDPQIQYCLTNEDEQPVTVNKSGMKPVRYTNLKGGDYSFTLSLIDSSTHDVRQSISVKIVKERAFYEKWWFGILCLMLLVVLMGYLLHVYMLRKTKAIKQRAEEQQRLFKQTATALVNAIDAKDRYTHGHSSRVAYYSKKIAQCAGKSAEDCDYIYYSALLHDVGKIGVPEEIINMDRKLTEEEYERIKEHPIKGVQILRSIVDFPNLSVGAHYHHERYDGKGYPDHLKGTDIPEIARIIAVADAYDAMTSTRSYRETIPQQKVREELIKGSGTQFDPEFAKIMLHLIDLDSEYEMKEREEVKELGGKDALVIDEHRGDYSDGILLNQFMTTIKLRIDPEEAYDHEPSPSLILFDSLDGRVHYDDEKDEKELLYFEYGEVWYDGECVTTGARKIQAKTYGSPAGLEDGEYTIEALRIYDHALIRVVGNDKTVEFIIALPDSSRFAYISITGAHCRISEVCIEKSETESPEDYIPRIAEKVSFIDGPEGDVPSIQVDGYRADHTEGILIKDGMQITFHTKTLPTARLVWHCPYIDVYSSSDGRVNGEDYRDFTLVRLDGESWESDPGCTNEIIVNKGDDFDGWDSWKDYNREGFDCTVNFEKKDNKIIVTTGNAGIFVKSMSIINDKTENVYAALTGDQIVITNIRISYKEQ